MSLTRFYPELKNARWLSVFKAGREARINAELAQSLPVTPPLYSHSATYQSLFKKGWNSVRPEHIAYQRQGQFHPRIQQILQGGQ